MTGVPTLFSKEPGENEQKEEESLTAGIDRDAFFMLTNSQRRIFDQTKHGLAFLPVLKITVLQF